MHGGPGDADDVGDLLDCRADMGSDIWCGGREPLWFGHGPGTPLAKVCQHADHSPVRVARRIESLQLGRRVRIR